MTPILLALLFAPDAWVGPTDTAPPNSPTVTTKNVYNWTNSTGHTVSFGGSGTSTYSVPLTLSRSVVVSQDMTGNWSEPTGWTAFFATLGDQSVTVYVTWNPNSVTYVPDGSTYFHDVKIHRATNFEGFGGDANNPGHSVGRTRVWETRDPSEDNEYSKSGPGAPGGT